MFDRVIVSPEIKNVLASQLVQTNTLLDSQTTNTHPSPHQPKTACSLGVSVSVLHFSSCDLPCRRISTLHRSFDPCNSKFIFDLPESLPVRATVAVPCGLATRTTLHTSSPVRKTDPFAPPHALVPVAFDALSFQAERAGFRGRSVSKLHLSDDRLASQATGWTSSGESLRTLPTALPTLCRVTLAGSTWSRVAARRSGTSLLRTPGSIQSSMCSRPRKTGIR
jgi:hypothetical protein